MKIFKILADLIYALLIAFIILIALSLVLTKFNTPIQYKLYTVQSGSMEPTIKVGSLILVKPQTEYQKGDIVNYRTENNPDKTVTHRIIEVSKDIDLNKISFRTKGDANNTPDPELIDSSRVTGKVFLSLPYLGYPVAFVKTQTGLIVLIIIPATLIIYSEIMNIKKETEEMIKKSKAKKEVSQKQKANEEESEEKVVLKPKLDMTKKKKTKEND
ncbi:signal peptidase I [Candidatus Beckwithbacteria bacterium]|nr:signal peptidase I [Candidatus Beckwithbacteria bacterium]